MAYRMNTKMSRSLRTRYAAEYLALRPAYISSTHVAALQEMLMSSRGSVLMPSGTIRALNAYIAVLSGNPRYLSIGNSHPQRCPSK